MTIDPATVAAFVERTCADSGVPVTPTNPDQLAHIGRIMTPARIAVVKDVLRTAKPIHVDPSRGIMKYLFTFTRDPEGVYALTRSWSIDGPITAEIRHCGPTATALDDLMSAGHVMRRATDDDPPEDRWSVASVT